MQYLVLIRQIGNLSVLKRHKTFLFSHLYFVFLNLFFFVFGLLVVIWYYLQVKHKRSRSVFIVCMRAKAS